MSITSLAPLAGTALSRAALDRAAAAIGARRRAEVEVLESALAWAHAHVVTDLADSAGWRSETIHAPGSRAALFGERPLPIAGPGAPLVAEFAVVELAAALELSHEATFVLLGDVLDLAHRLPRLWALVRSQAVPVRLGREAARESRDLTPDAARHADRLLAWQPRRLNPHRVGVLVHEARLYADPDRAIADHDAALARRRVEVHHEEGALGVSEVFMSLDTGDAIAFDHTVSAMATTMKALGHGGDLGARRAHAVGLLADPQQALHLLAAAGGLDDDDPRTCVADDAAHATPSPFRRPTPPGGAGDVAGAATGERGGAAGQVRLVVHVTDRHLLAPASADRFGVARCPQLGPMLIGRLRTWLLTAGTVIIEPVVDLDPAAHPPVDRHDPPARMAAMVRHRDQTCVFPACTRPSAQADLDHIDAYVPISGDTGAGPPGQTRPDNLAPLCRRHHRAKTFGTFTYRRRDDGAYEWTLPSGRVVTTDPPRPRPLPPEHRQPPRRP
ncbi:hypothetical protein SAMN04489844_2087 [Nocardioides exalbidus]|uniref:HNH nuclease domain-containing protein n=1 Tax=Nocardioides exalbidus TaxID=402596 RepID=A0A1H4RLA1_9ACTN|nr:HNH endonuclease signature motif containing protein [Nocardioides exalbidus]SEC32670.1 hypothetical protein SAMN04489844_2087 [Nocardioides exalbidus]